MRHAAGCLALAACLVAGSIADAAPVRHRHHHRHTRASHEPKHQAKVVEAAASRDDEVVVIDDPGDDRAERVVAPAKLSEHVTHRAQDWHLAIGPNVWAASVDAKVSLGGKSVTTGIDFFQLEHHVRYGVPVLAEARYGRLSIVGDFTYGVVDVEGGRDVGPLMVTVAGAASSLQVDGFAGYRVAGDDQSPLSLEARGGVRYQRTAIAASVGVDGSAATSFASVTASADALAGARVFVRASSWLYLSGAADVGLFGSSTTTWSASADASARITSRALVSVGWRTLTTEGANVSVVMHGPRAALQLLF